MINGETFIYIDLARRLMSALSLEVMGVHFELKIK